jgi:hypothetical protein
MRELSLHLLDIARNSVEAGATRLQLTIIEDSAADRLSFSLGDNGRGMDAETLGRVTDAFYTTRTTRRQGLGLALLRATCERCEGALEISSTPGVGTVVRGTMRLSHLDRPPLGNMGAVIQALACDTSIQSVQYKQVRDGKEFHLDTSDVMCNLEGGNITDPQVLIWLARMVNEELAGLG